jgi:hypothetical protein
MVGLHLGAVRVSGTALANEGTRLGIAYDDLDGLRGGVDSCDKRHGQTLLPGALLPVGQDLHVGLERIEGISDGLDA